MSLHTPQQRNLSLAVADLNGQWAGVQADHLFYHRQNDTYQWANPELRSPGDGYEWVTDFKSYAQEVAKERRLPPTSFDVYVIVKPAPGLFGGGRPESVKPESVAHPKDAQYLRAALLQQDDDVFVVQVANFQDTWVEQSGQLHRITTAPGEGAFADARKTFSKNGVMLVSDKHGLTPWSVLKAVKSMTLPESVSVRCTYSRQQGMLIAKLFHQANERPEMEVNSNTHNGLSALQQAMSAHAIHGDTVTVTFRTPPAISTEADESGSYQERSVGVDMNVLVSEFHKTVRYMVEESLRDAQVDLGEFKEPLSQVVTQRVTADDDAYDEFIAGREVTRVTPYDHIEVTLGLHAHVPADAEMVSALEDTVMEVANAPIDIEVEVRRSDMNNPYPGIQSAFKEAVNALGNRRAMEQLPALFAEHHLQWSDVKQQDHSRDMTALTSELSTSRERADALERLISAALTARGMSVIASQLPTQTKEIIEPAHDLLYVAPAAERLRR